MAIIDNETREIRYKVAFYGPGLAGKTTNMFVLHSRAHPGCRLESRATETDRLLSFDFSPLRPRVGEPAVSVSCHTLPGCVFYEESRIEVLRGVDGVVCVIDSQEARLDGNVKSMTDLDFYLQGLGYEPSKIPRVIQYNKQDLPGSLSPEDLRAALNPAGWPEFSAAAVYRRGVFESTVGIIRLVLEKAGMPADASAFEDWLIQPPKPAQVPEPGPTQPIGWLARLRQAAALPREIWSQLAGTPQ